MMKLLLCAVIGYLLGSISGSIVVSKLLYCVDIRKHGSGNAGMTNSIRIFGAKAGVFTALIDLLKTAAAVLIGRFLCSDAGVLAAGAGAMLGHAFPVFFSFKGGKSVLCIAVVLSFVCLPAVLIGLAVFIIVMLASRMVSLGSICAMPAAVLGAVFFGLRGTALIFTIAACAFVVFMHRDNISRIIKGTEKKISLGKETTK